MMLMMWIFPSKYVTVSLSLAIFVEDLKNTAQYAIDNKQYFAVDTF
jgi:hypothetical protein